MNPRPQVQSTPATCTPRRYAPKGNRPLRIDTPPTFNDEYGRHQFHPRLIDPVSCIWCNLPRANKRMHG